MIDIKSHLVMTHKEKLIACSDAMPKEHEACVVYIGMYPVVACYSDGSWYKVTLNKKYVVLDRIDQKINHWVQIPNICEVAA